MELEPLRKNHSLNEPGDGPRRGAQRLNRSFELMAPDSTFTRVCQEPFLHLSSSIIEWRLTWNGKMSSSLVQVAR
jgi:hypothetical protein